MTAVTISAGASILPAGSSTSLYSIFQFPSFMLSSSIGNSSSIPSKVILPSSIASPWDASSLDSFFDSFFFFLLSLSSPDPSSVASGFLITSASLGSCSVPGFSVTSWADSFSASAFAAASSFAASSFAASSFAASSACAAASGAFSWSACSASATVCSATGSSSFFDPHADMAAAITSARSA